MKKVMFLLQQYNLNIEFKHFLQPVAASAFHTLSPVTLSVFSSTKFISR